MTLLIGARYRSRLETGLSKLCEHVIWLPDNPAVDERLAGHADLSVFLWESQAVVSPVGEYDLLVNFLTNRGCHVSRSEVQSRLYPADAGLCAFTTGVYSIFNPKTVDKGVLKLLPGTLIQVSQGYTKCSVCTVSERAIMTSDTVIARKARDAGMDVLLIDPDGIVLDGYDHGFIGGAAFLVNRTTLAFTGTLERIPDKRSIEAFTAKYGVNTVFLTSEPLFDVGGVITLP